MTNMKNRLDQLYTYLKQLSDTNVDALINTAAQLLAKESAEKELKCCPYCKDASKVIRYGKKRGKQRFLCKSCSKTFITTTNTIMYNSHCCPAQWKELISDTLNGNAIDFTAKKTGLSHDCVFHMRHKLLLALQDQEMLEPTKFNGATEMDECFVLESYKGTKIPDNYWRKSRKHGAKAKKRGISDEYICICAGCERNGTSYAQSINRAKPDSEEIKAVMYHHIGENVLALCDGLRSYHALSEINNCKVETADENNKGFFNLNRVNGFHSFIKRQYDFYRGVATKYINRYNALFSLMYNSKELYIDEVYNILCSDNCQNRYFSKEAVKTLELLVI